MTTNTTSTASQAPAVSIETPEFTNLLYNFGRAFASMPREQLVEAGVALIAHIDAKLAQASNDSSSEGRIYQRKVDEKIIERWKARATAAEAKLEAIRMAIDGLARFYTVGDEPVEYPDSDFLMYKDVSALFQPQPQADESGLPG